ncbi:putative endonuclease lcl3 [Podila minutissima]|uniref:Endonuclease lcl3 n=1 Tax=Podila minutissima TaxID=64525 RepID=A0A9P5SM08_9FUNG|nr:putative endonuclease lcl3 [Podila minutissima]
MVWPFTSSSSKESNASATPSSSATSDKLSTAVEDTLDKVEHEASEMYQSTRASLEGLKVTATVSSSSMLSSLNIPPSMEPYLITTAVFGIATGAVVFYRTRLRRIPTPAYMTPNMLRGKRIMRGKVTSVGDSDNFRFYHTPGGIWAGWGWLRHVPTTRKALMEQTIPVRIAGVDAPENAHFGMPAQPFGKESLAWLRHELNGKSVLIQPYARDRVEMLKVGYGQIYRQAGSEYGGMLKEFEKIEAKAKSRKIGIWSQKDMVTAAEHKKKHLRGEE